VLGYPPYAELLALAVAPKVQLKDGANDYRLFFMYYQRALAIHSSFAVSVRRQTIAGDVPGFDAVPLAALGALPNLHTFVFGNACPNVLHQPTFGAVVIALQRVFNPNARTLQFIFDEQLLS